MKKDKEIPVQINPARLVQRGIIGNKISPDTKDAGPRTSKRGTLRSQRGSWGLTDSLTPEEEYQKHHEAAVAEALAEKEASKGLLPPARTRSSRKILFTSIPGDDFIHKFNRKEALELVNKKSQFHECIAKIFDDDERDDEYVASPDPSLKRQVTKEILVSNTNLHNIDLSDIEIIKLLNPEVSVEAHPKFVYAAQKQQKKQKRRRITKEIRSQFDNDEELDKHHPPTSFHESQKRETRNKWDQAGRKEMNSLLDRNTFTLMSRKEALKNTPDLEILPSHPVYTVKKSGIYKVRRVCGARNQETTHKEVYSPTARLDTFKMLCAMSVQKNWQSALADFSNAYLHAEMPKGKHIAITFGDGMLKLVEDYGLANSGKLWGDLLAKTLKDIGIDRCSLDPCCFYSKDFHGAELYMCIFVDDIAAFTTDLKCWNKLLASLRGQGFLLTDEGLTNFLGANITKSPDGSEISLSQEAYVESMAVRFTNELEGVKQSGTPLPPKTRINLTQCSKEPADIERSKTYKFREMVGCLVWLAGYTRPDLLYPTQQLAQVMSFPTQNHYNLLKRVVAYTIFTKGRKLTYRSSEGGAQLQAYVDANYNVDDTGRSIAGWHLTMSGASITSSSKIIKTVATSSTHAEIHALFHCSKDVLWARRLLEEIGIPEGIPTPIYEDNTACLKFAETLQVSNRTKHLEIKYFHIKQIMNWGEIILIYIPTKDQVADALTKPLDYQSHSKFTDQASGKLPLPGKQFNAKDMVLLLRYC
jgi:hypothetical protein